MCVRVCVCMCFFCTITFDKTHSYGFTIFDAKLRSHKPYGFCCCCIPCHMCLFFSFFVRPIPSHTHCSRAKQKIYRFDRSPTICDNIRANKNRYNGKTKLGLHIITQTNCTKQTLRRHIYTQNFAFMCVSVYMSRNNIEKIGGDTFSSSIIYCSFVGWLFILLLLFALRCLR